MAKISIETYLFFKGNAKEAMEFYKGVFGGELEVSTMADSPPEAQMPGAKPTDVMHASLKGLVNIMASDSQTASDKAAKVELSLGGTDEAEMRNVFDQLSAGGKIFMPLKKESWGDVFGSFTDKFGVE